MQYDFNWDSREMQKQKANVDAKKRFANIRTDLVVTYCLLWHTG